MGPGSQTKVFVKEKMALFCCIRPVVSLTSFLFICFLNYKGSDGMCPSAFQKLYRTMNIHNNADGAFNIVQECVWETSQQAKPWTSPLLLSFICSETCFLASDEICRHVKTGTVALQSYSQCPDVLSFISKVEKPVNHVSVDAAILRLLCVNPPTARPEETPYSFQNSKIQSPLRMFAEPRNHEINKLSRV